MIPSATASLAACVVAAHVLGALAAPSLTASPCPSLFRYDSVNDPGTWTGTLVLQTDDELQGVWIRAIFDTLPKEVTAEGYEVVDHKYENNELLIKNGDTILKAGSTTNLKITVKYDGDKFPNLIGFRLNAKTVCPDYNTLRKDHFKGDHNAEDFLSVLQSHVKHVSIKPGATCGLRNSEIMPWQASLFLTAGGKEQYVSDATLISPSHVILPAHCVTFNNDVDKVPRDSLSVALAGNNEIVGVSKVLVHRGYDPDTLIDDVAILELKSALTVNDKVRPVCLGSSKASPGRLSLVGRGIGNGGVDNEVVETPVEQLGSTECVSRNPLLSGLTVERSFCVSYLPGKSTCAGNSGSGIITIENNVATLRGFVTLGPVLQGKNTCDDSTALAINIDDYYRWILRTIS